MGSDRLSWLSRTIYGVERMKTPFRSSLSDISWSENSSRTSLTSVSTAGTTATSVADESEYDAIEDILVLKADATSRYAFSDGQNVFRDDLHNHLNEALGSHEYLSRLRLVGRDSVSFRPAVLITTKSARTKLSFARYLRKGPSILRRLVANELDIHIVLNSFGLASEADITLLSYNASDVDAFFNPDPNAKSDNGRITIKDHRSNKVTTCVSTIRLELDRDIVMLSVYHPLALFDESKKHWHEALRHTVDAPELGSYCGAVSFYYDQFCVQNSTLTASNASEELLDSKSMSHEPYVKSYAGDDSDLERPARERNAFQEASNNAQESFLHNLPANSSSSKILLGDIGNPSSHASRAQLLYYSEEADWTIWDVPPEGTKQQSVLNGANEVNGKIIDEFSIEPCKGLQDVTVSLPDENVSGKLESETAIYQIGSKQMRLKVISLEKPLKRGHSGALVTHQNKACGMVVAVDDCVAEAYILAFDRIVSDIERITGRTVRLPSTMTIAVQTVPLANVQGMSSVCPSQVFTQTESDEYLKGFGPEPDLVPKPEAVCTLPSPGSSTPLRNYLRSQVINPDMIRWNRRSRRNAPCWMDYFIDPHFSQEPKHSAWAKIVYDFTMSLRTPEETLRRITDEIEQNHMERSHESAHIWFDWTPGIIAILSAAGDPRPRVSDTAVTPRQSDTHGLQLGGHRGCSQTKFNSNDSLARADRLGRLDDVEDTRSSRMNSHSGEHLDKGGSWYPLLHHEYEDKEVHRAAPPNYGHLRLCLLRLWKVEDRLRLWRLNASRQQHHADWIPHTQRSQDFRHPQPPCYAQDHFACAPSTTNGIFSSLESSLESGQSKGRSISARLKHRVLTLIMRKGKVRKPRKHDKDFIGIEG